MVAAHNNTLEGVGILLSGLFVATSKGLDANLLAKLCVLIYLCRLIFIFACEPSFLPLRVAAVAWTITLAPDCCSAIATDYADIDLLRTTVWITNFMATIVMMVASCFPDSVLPLLQA